MNPFGKPKAKKASTAPRYRPEPTGLISVPWTHWPADDSTWMHDHVAALEKYLELNHRSA